MRSSRVAAQNLRWDMDNYALLVAIFFAGFIVGAATCFLVMAQIYKHKRVKDELLKTKRAAIRAQRTLDRFFKTSLDMFSEIDSAHQQYVQFLKEAAQKIAPEEADSHEFLNQGIYEGITQRQESKRQESKRQQSETTKEVTGTLGEIPTPKVLRPNEIQTEFTDPVKVKKNIEKPSEEETETKEEVVEEEKLKV